ncbi:hypothetical protein [Promicromonospora iranensis]|uniref:Uncharacterized protein n=1 Tax=Promicromonospora iranensis TaxID=1105144 RepID=A0ABU2CRL6_9MICO|nr:hypothetical protein [Promicromonospora iranensis]MDR7383981.1 hypothetical protein [Promicromonospora iranensis]
MSTITSSDALSAHVRGYAQAVRLHLAHLGQDVVDDLTDGLEADLTEAVLDEAAPPADGAGTQAFDLAARFGPADEYATELRTAAGLPPAPAGARAGRGPGRVIGEAWAGVSERWRSSWRPLTSTPGWTAFVEFARSLAPAWWILRGWVGAQVVMWPFGMSDVTLWPSSTGGQIVVIAAIVVSVQWGRGRWVPRWTWFPRANAVASVAAALLAIPMVIDVEADSRPVVADYYSGYDSGFDEGFNNALVSRGGPGNGPEVDGVWVDGVRVSNLFAYDAAGDPIRDVQLFDDRGRPVRTIGSDATWDTWSVPDVPGDWSFQPAIASDGRTRWNVYPLSAVPGEQVGVDDGNGDIHGPEEQGHPVPPTGVQPQEMPWPFLKAPTAIENGVADRDDPGATTPARPGSDHPASDPARDLVRPGERATSDSGTREPTLEATQAD